jgi:Protein of unknown function (DUF2975)
MKKATNRLPKFLQTFFFTLEAICVTAAVVLTAVTIACPAIGTMTAWHIGEVGLVPESGVVVSRWDSSFNGSIDVGDFRGSVIIHSSPGGRGALPPLLRWYGMPMTLAYVVFSAMILDVLRRLFRNVESGETFTVRNIRLVHNIGAAIVVFTLASALAQTWFSQRLAAYLNQLKPGMSFTADDQVVTGPGQSVPRHNGMEFYAENVNAPIGAHGTRLHNGMNFTSISDTTPMPMTRHMFTLHINWSALLTGLLVIALGEVFRQGLALKQENELTI